MLVIWIYSVIQHHFVPYDKKKYLLRVILIFPLFSFQRPIVVEDDLILKKKRDAEVRERADDFNLYTGILF